MDPWCRKSAVVSEHAAVSSDQPMATSIGIDILKRGGNAADAAVATMAAVSVLQPMACGIGGDCHSLFYRHADKKIFTVNGSGRTGGHATLQKLLSAGITDSTYLQTPNLGLWVSVPGTVAGMCSVVKNFGSGKLTMSQILEPAINLAEKGVPVPQNTSVIWNKFCNKIQISNQATDLLHNGKPPLPGEKIYAPKLARSFKLIASHGVDGFYRGKIAENIVNEVQKIGGVLTLGDMTDHIVYKSMHGLCDAIFIDFHSFRIWEMQPNNIGLVALVALNVLKFFDLKSLDHNSAEYIHIVVEVIKYAYLECWNYLCDPEYNSPDLKFLLSDESGKRIKMQIDKESVSKGQHLIAGDNTSYVAVVDPDGNGCSFICSIFSNFGSGIIPEDCGFVLHDRVKSMNFDENSPNAYGPKKLPLHTTIPSMITDIKTNDLLAVFGVCGRWMQPQGHVQVLLNMIVFGMDPQVALNQPRFFVGKCEYLANYPKTLNTLNLEDGISLSVVSTLKQKGHEVVHSVKGLPSTMFGRGNIVAQPILWNKNATNSQRSWWAGADTRTDGCAMGF